MSSARMRTHPCDTYARRSEPPLGAFLSRAAPVGTVLHLVPAPPRPSPATLPTPSSSAPPAVAPGISPPQATAPTRTRKKTRDTILISDERPGPHGEMSIVSRV